MVEEGHAGIPTWPDYTDSWEGERYYLISLVPRKRGEPTIIRRTTKKVNGPQSVTETAALRSFKDQAEYVLKMKR